MAIYSSILAWGIPWTESEPGGLRSVGLQRVGHDLATEHTDTHSFPTFSFAPSHLPFPLSPGFAAVSFFPSPSSSESSHFCSLHPDLGRNLNPHGELHPKIRRPGSPEGAAQRSGRD